MRETQSHPHSHKDNQPFFTTPIREADLDGKNWVAWVACMAGSKKLNIHHAGPLMTREVHTFSVRGSPDALSASLLPVHAISTFDNAENRNTTVRDFNVYAKRFIQSRKTVHPK